MVFCGGFILGVKISVDEEKVPDDATLIVGFPGIGMVGGIAAEHLIGDLEMEQIGQIELSEFPPVAVVFEGRPRRPVRIFEGSGFLLVKSDMVVPKNCCPPLSKMLVDWVKDHSISKTIVLDSIASQNPADDEDQIWGTVSIHGLEEDLEDLGIRIMKKGVLSGASSMVSVECMEQEVPSYGVYAKANPQVPDARAAANLLDKVSGLVDVGIDVDDLVERAEELESKYERLVNRAREASEEMEEHEPISPMYG